MRAGASSVSTRDRALAAEAAPGAERVRGVQRRVRRPRRRAAATPPCAFQLFEAATGAFASSSTSVSAAAAERRVEPGDAAADDDQADDLLAHWRSAGFLLTVDNLGAESTMVSDPASENDAARAQPSSRSSCRCATGGSRCCSGSARSSRSPGAWSLPGGELARGETLEQSIRRHLAAKVDVRELAHLEQLETRSDPGRNPLRWELATAYLGLVPSDVDPALPGRHALAPGRRPARRSPSTTSRSCSPARDRLRGEALLHEHRLRARAATFTISELRDLYRAALGHDVSATNLQRVLCAGTCSSPTGDAAASRARRRPPGRALRLPRARARDHRPVRGAAAAYDLAA